jgi:hypothetical protein
MAPAWYQTWLSPKLATKQSGTASSVLIPTVSYLVKPLEPRNPIKAYVPGNRYSVTNSVSQS